MKGFLALVLVLFIGPLPGWTQVFNTPRDIQDAFRSGEAKVLLGFDSRRSFIGGQGVNILGVRAGFEAQGKARVGFGMYFLRRDISQQFFVDNPQGSQDSLQSRLNFMYSNVFFEPILLATKRWEVSIPFHIGVGEVFFEGPHYFELAIPKTVVLTEISAAAQYKILPWIGIGAGAGYRQMLKSNPKINKRFSAPIYMINLKIYSGYILRKLLKLD